MLVRALREMMDEQDAESLRGRPMERFDGRAHSAAVVLLFVLKLRPEIQCVDDEDVGGDPLCFSNRVVHKALPALAHLKARHAICDAKAITLLIESEAGQLLGDGRLGLLREVDDPRWGTRLAEELATVEESTEQLKDQCALTDLLPTAQQAEAPFGDVALPFPRDNFGSCRNDFARTTEEPIRFYRWPCV
jgi:hypothetical protein